MDSTYNDAQLWFEMTDFEKEDILDAVHIRNIVLRNIIGEIFTKTLFGNDCRCINFWIDRHNSNYIIFSYIDKDGSQHLETKSIDNTVDLIKRSKMSCNLSVSNR